MKDGNKTKEQLINELIELRKLIAESQTLITKRNQAEEALQFTRFSLDNAADTMVCVDHNGRFIDVNDAFCRSVGYSREELRSKSVHDIDPNYPTEIWPEFWEKLKQSGSLTFESCHRTKEGKVFPVEITTNYFEYNGKEYHCSFARDITERKQAEEVLRHAEEKYRSIFDNAVEGIFQTTPEGLILSVNPALARIFGYDSPEDIMNSVKDIGRQLYVDPEKRKEHLRLLNEKGVFKNFEAQMYRKDGSTNWVSINTRILRDDAGKPLLFEGFVVDITERKRGEDEIKSLSKFPDENPNPIFRIGSNGIVLYANETAGLLLQSLGSAVGSPAPSLWRDWITHALASQAPQAIGIEHDGRIYAFDVIPITEGGYFNIYARDITERKRAEEELNQLKHQYELILQSAGEGIVGLDLEGKITFANPFAVKITGYSVDELIGQNLHKLVHYRKPDGTQYPYEECPSYETLKNGVLRNIRDEVFFRKDGTNFPVRYTSTPIIEEGVIKGAVVTFRDITERKQADEKLKISREELRAFAARLQSIREEERTIIAREIHDDIGQALTALKMDIAWLKNRFPREEKSLLEKTKSMSTLIETTSKTMKRISSELRPGLLDDLGLPAAIEWYIGEFENRTGISCKLTIEPEEISLERDLTTAIFRILQETLTNVARHANATKITVSLLEKNGTLQLKVKDNGKGITEKQIFSSKSFGLIGIRERVYQWRGEVTIEGKPKKGTTVTVTIPI